MATHSNFEPDVDCSNGSDRSTAVDIAMDASVSEAESTQAIRRIAPDDCSDRELIEAILCGEDRLEELMRRYNQRVYRVARMVLRDAAAAEDVAQEAWLRAFENLHRFEGRARFSTWLLRIAFNEAAAQRRRMLREVRVDPSSPTLEQNSQRAATPGPEDQLATRRVAEALEVAIEGLPQKLRSAYVLRDLEGLTTRECATTLGVSAAAIKVRLHRARAALRVQLRSSGAIDPAEVFPFGFERCDRLVAAVLGRVSVVTAD